MIELLDVLEQERQDLMMARELVSGSDYDKIEKRLVVVEATIQQLITTDDLRLIEEAKSTDTMVLDTYTLILRNVQSRKDTLLTLIEDKRVIEAIEYDQ